MTYSGEELLEQLADVYRNLRFYKDTGFVLNGSDKHEFRTYFSRPKIRFEFSDLNFWKDGKSGGTRIPTEEGNSVWVFDGKNCLGKRFCDEQVKNYNTEEMNQMIERQFVLSLLCANNHVDKKICSVKELKQLESTILDGKDCFVYSGKLSRDNDIEISVDKEYLLIRRIRLKEWFRQMEQKGIDNELPNLKELPFSKEIFYTDIGLKELENSHFSKT